MAFVCIYIWLGCERLEGGGTGWTVKVVEGRVEGRGLRVRGLRVESGGASGGFDGGRLREVEDGEWNLYDDCK